MAHRDSKSVFEQNNSSSRSFWNRSRQPSAPAEPLIDSDWLLGPEKPSRFSARWIILSAVFVGLVFLSVVSAPTWSRMWLQSQLATQFLHGPTADQRRDGMIGLAKLLPESLPNLVAGFSNSNPVELKSLTESLADYCNGLQKQSVESRRAAFAELAYSLEKQLDHASNDSAAFISELSKKIYERQHEDNHPAAAITAAACRRILTACTDKNSEPRSALVSLDGQVVKVPHNATSGFEELASSSKQILSDRSIGPSGQIEPAVSSILGQTHEQPYAATSPSPTTPLLSNNVTPAKLSSFRLGDGRSEASNSPPASQATASSPEAVLAHRQSVFTPVDHGADSSSISNGRETIGLKQRLLQAHRYLPLAGGKSVSIEGEIPNESSGHEVLGISRQKTPDLLRLLNSVQPRVAQAAFEELEKNRLSRAELELAVELARGTTQNRITVMERLVADTRFDPLAWLSWMSSETDRDVRFKAVSLLGSLNRDDANHQLRQLVGRERDQEISRHIQQALLANGVAATGNR
jgi:hypothetical protein